MLICFFQQDEVLMDIHLSRHWQALHTSITNRATASVGSSRVHCHFLDDNACLQYVEPFLTVDLRKMALAFGCDIEVGL